MDYKEKTTILRVCSSKKGDRCSHCPAFGQGDRYCKNNAMRDGATAITELLARAEAAEARCKELEDRAEKVAEIASDLCDDFTDFVTGGVHNAAPYCANRRPECVNAHGWCNGDNRVCRGFLPKAAGIKKEE